jgi:flagellar hook protein FlgE
MYSAVSGLKGHQTMLDVIGNNIANVNTVGFKSSRVLFKDLYYQTLSNATAPTATTGSKNAMQLGYGSNVASIDVITTRSGYQQTSRTLDLYISGEGYFAVKNEKGGTQYTRVGSFSFDSNGTLKDANGNCILGYLPATPDDLTQLTIADFNDYTGIYIAENGDITGTNTKTKSIDVLGQVALATFPNPDGLTQMGDMYYSESLSSGIPNFEVPGTALTGQLVSGGLEMSNVDLTKEFTDMIVAQRGFQANSRVITTSDQVLEEIVNLKR